MSIGHLEVLHRSGDLVPLFRLDQGEVAIVKAYEPDGFMVPTPDLGLDNLRRLSKEGRLISVGDEFTPWSRYTVTRGDHLLWVSTFLYSPWQLLALVEAQVVLSSAKRLPHGSFGPRYSVRRSIPISTRMTDAIAVILSALEPLYWPDIIQSVRFAGSSIKDRDHWFDTYLNWIRERKAAELAEWLGMSPDEIVALADGVAVRIKSSDPIGDWADLTRMMSPDKWKDLRGEARIAIDHRIAAEMLFRLRDDLAEEGAAQPLSQPPAMAWTPQHDRLDRLKDDLDRVLTSYGLSPHPSLVMPVEGATEMILVGRTMEHLHVPRQRNYIELFDIGGNSKDYGLLARYVAAPELGKPVREGLVLLNRPITRFYVVSDPENRLRTQSDRDERQKQILDSIIASLPEEYRTDKAREQLASLVTLDTWTDLESFEFAHFTDDEIVDAIKRVHAESGQAEPNVFGADVESIRKNRGNLKSILRKFPLLADRKDRLAEALWPVMKDRLDQHVKAGTLDSVPVGRVLRRAVELATMSFRRNIWLEH